jgi:hypothetical protein
MDKYNQPPGGDPQDFTRTQEIGPVGSQPGPGGQSGQGQPGDQGSQPGGPGWNQPTLPPGQAWGQASGSRGGAGRTPPPYVPRQRRNRGLWLAAGLAVVALLVGGTAFAVTKLASSSASGPTSQASQLNSLLNSASSPGAASAAETFGETSANSSTSGAAATCKARAEKLRASGHPLAAVRALLVCRPMARLRLVGGEHGEFTFKSKNGTTTLAYERGAIQSVSGSDVVVKAADGTTWTWVLQSSTVIRQSGKKVSSSALSDGEKVFAGGPVSSGTYQAKLIVVQPSSPSPSASASAPAS